jgi:hypothetical protein
MTTEDANALLKRMQFTYRTPADIRGNPEAVEERLRIYRHALERFDADILDRAWLKAAARQRYPQWPDCVDIVQAAEEFHSLKHPRVKVDDGWVEKATSMADSYTRRFMKTSAVAVRAREGGFERELKEYIVEASWVQAQYILGRKDIAYRSTTLFDHDKPDDEFFARAWEQAAKGCIQVRVPHAIIERWRDGAERGRVR